MAQDVRRYARFYYVEFMRDYPDVYADDAAFSAFLRLLATAEMAWPVTPELPRSVRPKGLRLLVDRGLVKVTGHTFLLKGFVRERTVRAENARNAAAQRWHSDSNASAMPKSKKKIEEEKAIQGLRSLDDARALEVVKP